MLGSVTAAYDLTPQDVGDPEIALTRQGRWDKPDQIQSTLQRQDSPIAEGGAAPSFKSAALYTYSDTATIKDPAQLGNPALVARFLLAGALDKSSAVQSDEKQLGSYASASATTTDATLSVSPTKISLDPSIQLGDLRLWAGLNANITTDQVDSSNTTTYAEMPSTTQRPRSRNWYDRTASMLLHHRLASMFVTIPRSERPRGAPS